jgi:hypothetical protein
MKMVQKTWRNMNRDQQEIYRQLSLNERSQYEAKKREFENQKSM